MTDPAVSFATKFDTSFLTATNGLSHNEIPLFRALQSALIGAGGKLEIEEYHGTSHQVTFTGNGSYARTNSRCELSDLLIVIYSPVTREVRLTYLQAKSERATLPSVCGRQFSANLEQWFLLASRPMITGVASFNPPPDLLSNALLPSVGSFVFFYRDPSGGFQIYYAAANYLAPPIIYCKRYGKVQALGPCDVIVNAGHIECVAVCGNKFFAERLYRLEIGTPVHKTIANALPIRNWLAANLRVQIQNADQTDKPSGLAQELLEILAPEEHSSVSYSFGAKSLIIINSRGEPNINAMHRIMAKDSHSR